METPFPPMRTWTLAVASGAFAIGLSLCDMGLGYTDGSCHGCDDSYPITYFSLPLRTPTDLPFASYNWVVWIFRVNLWSLYGLLGERYNCCEHMPCQKEWGHVSRGWEQCTRLTRNPSVTDTRKLEPWAILPSWLPLVVGPWISSMMLIVRTEAN